MDPITVLQSRIEQLEAKLGFAANNAPPEAQSQPMHHGDSATANLLQASQAMNQAISHHEKMPEAMNMASELNNYTDPKFADNVKNMVQQGDMHMREVAAAENSMRHHCHCMHQCRQQAPVMESEPIQKVPAMQESVNQLSAAASHVRAEAEEINKGVSELAETVGQTAANASEQLAAVAQKVDQVEDKKFPKRRNGLD